ncbi:MAG TPA: response regulator transcription factor [Steroidobacteraceae bacterium]|nr:response regulator transcription factor [Steroidobacteraceae bacterium]
MVIRVLVATGVRAYREGLQRVLQGAEGIALAGIASTAEQTVEQACKLLPSVILLDIGMAKSLALAGQMLGIQRVCGFVLLGKPEAYADVVVCLPAEVVAFVARDATVADFLNAIRAAGGADVAVRVTAPSPAVAIPVPLNYTGYLPRQHPPAIAHLTEREMEILKLIQQGLPNKTISRQLGIELSTVKNHVHSILAKLGAHNRGEAISLLYRYESSGRAVSASTAEPEGAGILPLDQPAVA